MIETWVNGATRRFAETGKSRFTGMDVEAAQDLLAVLAAATSLKDLSPLKSVGLHKLDRDRMVKWAMTINGRWRLCFRLEDGHACDVGIVDYHEEELR